MIVKTCNITGLPMRENDLDFGQQMNRLKVLDASGVETKYALDVRVVTGGQFPADCHVSREGMEKLLVEVADNLPSEVPATKVPHAKAPVKTTATTDTTTAKPGGGESSPGASTDNEKTGNTLTRK